VESTEVVSTCLTPFAHVPGILPGIWGVMVALGIVVALTIQWLVIASEHLAVGPVWTVSLLSIAVGIIGAKAWYLLLYRALEGWCIQGFVVASTLTAAILLIVLGVPVGVFLDATTPGLLFGMMVGRIGCFFAGCCGGPSTASRFGVWSSDQRVGAHRVPTQLMESGLAGILGLAVLVAILHHGPVGGAFFVAGLSAYTLVRQGILHLRAEPRKTKLWSVITVALMALALIAAVILLVR
jgi:phosphatidylglycerol:prolipoprotein diacylglycerol transferase